MATPIGDHKPKAVRAKKVTLIELGEDQVLYKDRGGFINRGPDDVIVNCHLVPAAK